MPLPRLKPFVCPDCGQWLREVETTWGESLLLNAARDPRGRVVPWPSERLNGAAVARILPAGVPAEDDRTWSVHACRGVPGSRLFAEEPTHFGTRLMFSDARNSEWLLSECPGPHPGHQALPVLLKYADRYPSITGVIEPETDENGLTVFAFTPDSGEYATVDSRVEVLYNHDPDGVLRTLKTHGSRGSWIAELGLWQPLLANADEALLSFTTSPVKPCSLPL